MRIGVHVSIAGNICNAIDRAVALGCETIQIFSRNPRGWQASGSNPKDAAEFRRRKKEADIYPVLVHIPYVINLATPDGNLRRRSIKAYIEDLKTADMLGAEYFVTHPGSHVGSGEKEGMKRFSESLNSILGKAKPRCMILLENTAGSGRNLGYTFAHIKNIISRVKQKGSVGVCLDTEHAFSAGYNISTKRGLEDTLMEFDRDIGLDRLKAVHYNDSRSALGSRVDRHEHVGMGKIGKEGMRRIITHPKLNHLPFIMETPKKDPSDDIRNMKKARALLR
ncbi:deoxyribonuclease IV [Candidatus Omnitrophota bacterium]